MEAVAEVAGHPRVDALVGDPAPTPAGQPHPAGQPASNCLPAYGTKNQLVQEAPDAPVEVGWHSRMAFPAGDSVAHHRREEKSTSLHS